MFSLEPMSSKLIKKMLYALIKQAEKYSKQKNVRVVHTQFHIPLNIYLQYFN